MAENCFTEFALSDILLMLTQDTLLSAVNSLASDLLHMLVKDYLLTLVPTDPTENENDFTIPNDDELAPEYLGIKVLKILREQAPNLPFKDLIWLRTRFWMLADHDQGVKDLTVFNFVDLIESGSELLATVHTEHQRVRQLIVTKKDLLEWVEDPLRDQEDKETPDKIWARWTAPSVGYAPFSHPATGALKSRPCWCCDKQIQFHEEQR